VRKVGDALPISVNVPLFRGRRAGASGRWWAWSGPDRNGLKVPPAPKPRRSAGVRRGDSGHGIEVLHFCYSFASLNACQECWDNCNIIRILLIIRLVWQVQSMRLANFDVITKLMNSSWYRYISIGLTLLHQFYICIWWFYWYGSQLAGLVYKQSIHSNKHTKSQNRNYTENNKK